MNTVLRILILISFVSNLTCHNISTKEASRETIFKALNLNGKVRQPASISNKPTIELLQANRNKRQETLQNKIKITKGITFHYFLFLF